MSETTEKPDQLMRIMMAVFGLGLGIVGWWVQGISASQGKVITLIAEVRELSDEMDQVQAWQSEWPRTGLLQADVEQNQNIAFLRNELDRTNAHVSRLQDAISELQMDNARNSGRGQ